MGEPHSDGPPQVVAERVEEPGRTAGYPRRVRIGRGAGDELRQVGRELERDLGRWREAGRSVHALTVPIAARAVARPAGALSAGLPPVRDERTGARGRGERGEGQQREPWEQAQAAAQDRYGREGA